MSTESHDTLPAPPDTREAFEAWCGKNLYSTMKVLGGECPDGLPVYASTATHAAWWAWQAATAQQAAEVQRLRADAERYRWLRTVSVDVSYTRALPFPKCFYEGSKGKVPLTCKTSWWATGDSLDASVDAAQQDGAGEQPK